MLIIISRSQDSPPRDSNLLVLLFAFLFASLFYLSIVSSAILPTAVFYLLFASQRFPSNEFISFHIYLSIFYLMLVSLYFPVNALFYHSFASQFSPANGLFYFIPSSEFNAYLKQIKVKKNIVFFPLVTNTIYIFSL